MIQLTVHTEVIPLEPSVDMTKMVIKINVASILEELKLFDALFHIELVINRETYYYSFIRRNITEPIVIAYMFVNGIITNEDVISHTVQINYISKE